MSIDDLVVIHTHQRRYPMLKKTDFAIENLPNVLMNTYPWHWLLRQKHGTGKERHLYFFPYGNDLVYYSAFMQKTVLQKLQEDIS